MCPPLKKINKKILSFLFLGCLPVCDDSLSTRVYQSAPVQTSLPPTFCPLVLAIISNNHSRSGSKKTQQRLGTRWDTSMCSFFRHFSSVIQDFFFCSIVMFLFVFFCWKLPWTKKQNLLFVCFSAHMYIVLEENAVFTLSFRDHYGNAFLICMHNSIRFLIYSHSVSGLYSACFS